MKKIIAAIKISVDGLERSLDVGKEKILCFGG